MINCFCSADRTEEGLAEVGAGGRRTSKAADPATIATFAGRPQRTDVVSDVAAKASFTRASVESTPARRHKDVTANKRKSSAWSEASFWW